MRAPSLAIFLGAFLLFQVQPLVAKQILPWFGGSPAVWTVCMLFFQSGLVLGYAWAHGVFARLEPRWQILAHGILLAISLVALPIAADPSWKPGPADEPSLRILALLAATVGAPYVVLAATSPLLQAWSIPRLAGRSPYPLYALSNAASMLALLSYPVLVEPALGARAQAVAWSARYLLFAVLCLVTALGPRPIPPARTKHRTAPPETRILWAALAACASTLLLAVTNQVCQEVAVVPFLWVGPRTKGSRRSGRWSMESPYTEGNSTSRPGSGKRSPTSAPCPESALPSPTFFPTARGGSA